MPESRCTKPIDFLPVTGVLDLRSSPDQVRYNHYRWLEGFELSERRQLCRARGWRRLNASDNYNNEDFHDRLTYPRIPFTFAYQAETNSGFSKLFVGTQNYVGAKNNSTGNWQIIWDGIGGDTEAGASEVRVSAGQVNDTLVFTNGQDGIVYHVIDQPQEASGQFVSPIADLSTLNITQAKIAFSWNNVMFLMNLVEGGERVANGIVWSDFRRPLSWLPRSSSIAGRQTLDSGESILAVMPLDKSLLVYTTKAIWEGIITGAAGQAIAFVRRYTPNPRSNNEDLLAYKNTLISTGSEHYYWGKDGIYKFSLYDPAPVRVEWLHQATALIFDDVNSGRCNLHVGGWQSTKKTAWWSWAKKGESVPSLTITVNLSFPNQPFVSVIHEGFSVFFSYEPDILKSLRSFILEQCICTSAELETYGGGFQKEGAFCLPQASPLCDTRPNSFYSLVPLVTADGLTVEDYTGAADPGSLFTRLGDMTIMDLCGAEYVSDECNAESLFCMGAVRDLCLKQADEVFYREWCTNIAGCGTYSLDGYRSIGRSGALHFNKQDDNKVVHRFAMSFIAALAVKPSRVILRIGTSEQPRDPNTAAGRCVILWEELDPIMLECHSDADAAQHAADGTRPDDPAEWPIYTIGNFIYFELEIRNPDVTPQDTGGDVCFSRWTMDVEYAPRCA